MRIRLFIWSSKAAIAIAPILVVLAVACESSTSGADRVGVLPFQAGLADGGGVGEAGGGAGIDANRPPQVELPPCLACGAAKCEKEITACGDPCIKTLACVGACTNTACENECFATAPAIIGEMKTCLLGCVEFCSSLGETLVAAAEYAKADCARFAACAPKMVAYRFDDLAHCEERALLAILWRSLLPSNGTTAKELDKCTAAVSALDCDDYFSVRGAVGCDIRGKRTTGAACVDDSQCASGFCPSSEYNCATCAAAPAANAACVNKLCPKGMACNASNVCVVPPRRGEPCSASLACESPLFCAPSGTCEVLPSAVGSPCTDECDFRAGVSCKAGPRGTNNTCSSFTVGVVGASGCGQTGGNFFCTRSAPCDPQRACAKPPATGEACDDTRGPVCTYPALCVASRCKGLPAVEACQ